MNANPPPPSDDTLLAFDRGLLPEEEIDAVARWLHADPDAEQRLLRLTEGSADAAVDAIREPCEITAEISSLSGLTSRVVERVLSGGEQTLVTSGPDVPARLGEYQLLGPLGHGGMGSVYRARHARLQRDVAAQGLAGRCRRGSGLPRALRA